MTKKLKSVMAGLLCLACLPVPLTASAECTVTERDYTYEKWDGEHEAHEVIIESDLFKYTVSGTFYDRLGNPTDELHYTSPGVLETDVVDFNYIVTCVLYREDGVTPSGYILDSPLPYRATDYYARYDDVIAPYLEGELPQVGDLLLLKNYLIAETVFPVLEVGDLGYEGIPITHNYGSAIDLLGEDFKKVLYYEMYDEPMVVTASGARKVSESGEIYDLGNLNNDDSVDLIDVVMLNKHLMTGYSIGYYAKGCADVDRNGVVDEVDSLNILKSIIGLTDLNELS